MHVCWTCSRLHKHFHRNLIDLLASQCVEFPDQIILILALCFFITLNIDDGHGPGHSNVFNVKNETVSLGDTAN